MISYLTMGIKIFSVRNSNLIMRIKDSSLGFFLINMGVQGFAVVAENY